MDKIYSKKIMANEIKGFSKFSKSEKIDWLAQHYFSDAEQATKIIQNYWNSDEKLQKLHDDFIENSISNFYLPFAVAPNFLINNKYYTVPMVIEESSVVAAASKAAKFWASRGGFKTTVYATEKVGQVHFLFNGNFQKLQAFFDKIKPLFFEKTASLTQNMRQRGGGILDIVLKDKADLLLNYYQLHATFDSKNSMGANFINSCLEQFATTLKEAAENFEGFTKTEQNINIIMSILSNYVPNCLVRAEVSCKITDLADKNIDNPNEFASRFVTAVQIAKLEPYRAVTHNKGIMNGVDAVVLATGNDFRAIEAGVHAFASKSGQYASLSDAKIEGDMFYFWLEMPLALGTIGGLTALHPLVKLAFEILENPSAPELMQIIATAGLAQNFAALRSLTTTGIQAGHMKMHLKNILNQLEASNEEREAVKNYFKGHPVSHNAVVTFIKKIRGHNS